MKMTYGWYNWTLANQSRAGQIYFASTPEVRSPIDCLFDMHSLLHISDMCYLFLLPGPHSQGVGSFWRVAEENGEDGYNPILGETETSGEVMYLKNFF